MKLHLLIYLSFILISWDNPPQKKLSATITPKYFNLIKTCVAVFPDNTQFSIALIRKREVTYIGFKKVNDSLFFVNNRDSVFEIASVSKLFTTYLFADMVWHHQLNLDDPLHKYLPFKPKQVKLKGKYITLKTLANHTSGLPWDPDNFMCKDVNNPYADYNKEMLHTYLKKYIHINTPPGDTFGYSNLGMGLLGYAMELKTGKSYEELLQENVFSRFDMTSSSTDRTKIKNHFVKGLDSLGKVLPAGYFNVMAPAGGVLSNATDLAKFVQANFTNDSILAFQRKLTYTSSNINVALGWYTFKFAGTGNPHGYAHEGGGIGFRSSLIADTEDKLGIVVLSNVSTYHPKTGNITILAYELLRILYNEQKANQRELAIKY